jgi:hypothetical protein
MLRFLFWLLVLGAIGFVLNANLPIPGIATEEVDYTTTPVVTTCSTSGCLAVYTLELGNVGRSAQEAVRVQLRSDALDGAMIAPTVRRTSGTSVVSPATDRPGVETIYVGALAPEERAALVFALHAAARESVLGWDRVLVGVETSAGSARAAEVGALTVGRVVHALGRTVQRLVRAAQAAR